MIIDKVVVGSLEENCYIVTKSNKTIIIDPGADANKIIEITKDKNHEINIIIRITHFLCRDLCTTNNRSG